jgi:hypothetical protein
VFEISCRAKEPEFIPHPATWINAERWSDNENVAVKIQDDALKTWAEWINGDTKLFTAPRRETIEALISAKLVTPQRMKERFGQ